jgi:HrpA-like RNA helicase
MAVQPPILPVVAYREEIVRRLRSEQVLIVTGETGSGKTTQLCQYALDDGLLHGGLQVAVSQPRRIAAIEAARRVAAERSGAVGGEVANRRFDDTSTRTQA